MWGIGLEHEVRLGFAKNIVPNINLLKSFLEEKDDSKSQKLLKIINKKFDKNVITNAKEDKSSLQVRNINHIFNLRFNKLKKIDINSVYHMLEQVTILLSNSVLNSLTSNIQANIVNHYIDNYDTLKKSNVKVFKNFSDNIELTNTLRKMLVKKKLYSDRLNKVDVNTTLQLKSKSVKTLKFFEKVKMLRPPSLR